MVKPQIEAALPRVGLSGKKALVEKGVRIHDVPALAGIGSSIVQGPSRGCPKQGVAGPMNK